MISLQLVFFLRSGGAIAKQRSWNA